MSIKRMCNLKAGDVICVGATLFLVLEAKLSTNGKRVLTREALLNGRNTTLIVSDWDYPLDGEQEVLG